MEKFTRFIEKLSQIRSEAMVQNARPIVVETIAGMASQLSEIDLSHDEQQRVVGLLSALFSDMQAMRNMDVGANEPALVYEPLEK